MRDDFVLAVHTVTKQLQRVPAHYLEAFPYFEAVRGKSADKPKAIEKPATKEGAK